MRTMKASELILDYNLYPRMQVDSSHVRFMRQAHDGGVALPPPLIDKKSKRVIDGFHRITMYLRISAEHKIEVLERDYKNDAEMFMDAVRLNANHGRNLTPYDRTHCLLRGEELGLSVVELAAALSMTVEVAGEMRIERVGKMRVDGQSQEAPIKRTIMHMAGRSMNKRQWEANARLSGMNQMFYVNQLIDIIEADLLDVENKALIDRLNVLAGLISVAVKNAA